MSRSNNAYRGPKLPKELLEKVQGGNNAFKSKAGSTRKDRRHAERQQRKSIRSQGRRHLQQESSRFRTKQKDGKDTSEDEAEQLTVPRAPKVPPKQTTSDAKSLKSILKKEKPAPVSDDSEDATSPVVSRAVKSKLAEEDAEIAALEKKLGIKGKKSKSLKEDGLAWIADGSDDGSDDGGDSKLKRKRPEDTKWLLDKRLKAGRGKFVDSDGDEELSGSNVDDGNSEDVLSDDESDDFENFDPEDSEGSVPLDEDMRQTSRSNRHRENPYVAPVSEDATPAPKYVPPSLRRPAASDEEVIRQIRRQIQGLLNRLSESNMISILQSLEEVYVKNARQHVTSTLVDLLVGLISDPSILNETFLILHAGFATAVFKVMGTDFGAQLLEKVVESFDHYRESNVSTQGKQTLNLIGFLSCLYTFQLVGSSLIFDYIRLLLDEISEANTELLLRVIRTSGQQLRHDDPRALKDIVMLLQRSIGKVGEQDLSVRTKFMIETINDLKNNRMKTGVAASAVAAEHTTRMKKILGSLNNSRSLKTTEPLSITLTDIRDSDKRGKWWLVGASYLDPAKHAVDRDGPSTSKLEEDDAGYESETPGSVNLSKLARAQGMNTAVRRAIFITLLSSSDCRHAHMQLVKLHLKAKQMPEVARVLVHCVQAEQRYNPFYALVARQFCGEHKMRKAFQFTLWDAFKMMDEDEEEDEDKMPMVRVVGLAKFYGLLVASGALDLTFLKKLDFADLPKKAAWFVEVLLMTIFVRARKDCAAGGTDFEKRIGEIFKRVAGFVHLVQGLRLFLETEMAKAELAKGKKEKTAVNEGCTAAAEVLADAARSAPLVDEDDDEEDF